MTLPIKPIARIAIIARVLAAVRRASGQSRRWRAVPFGGLLVPLVALALTYLFFYEYLPPHKRVYLWSDAAGYHYPLQAYAFNALKEGRVPLWDSSIYCGISFVGNVQVALLYPPTWLLYAAAWSFPRLPFKAFEVFTLMHVWLAFVLCYLWLRGRTAWIASALGAFVFGCSGYMTDELLHPGVACAMAWLPLGLWGIDEFERLESWRPLWKLAAASALSLLAGYPALWLVNCCMWAIFAVARPTRLRLTIGVMVALAGSMVLSMVQVLPALQARSMMRVEPKYGPGAYGWKTLLASYLLPNWFDFNPGHPTDYDPGCLYLYLGLPALFAIAWIVRRHELRSYAQPLLGLVAALILANPPAPLVRAVEAVPALDYVMQPFNFYAGVSAMAALITALALESYLGAAAKQKTPDWAIPVVGAAVGAWIVHQLKVWANGGHFATHQNIIAPAVIAFGLFSFGLWAVRGAVGRSRVILAALVLLMTGVDYKVFGAGRWFNAVSGDLDDAHDAHGIRGISSVAFEALRANRSYRIMCDELASPYPTDLRVWNLATPQGFDPFLPVQYRERIERWVKFSTNRVFFLDIKNGEMLQALGVRYVITHEGVSSDPFLAKSSEFRLVGPDDSFYRVYEYLHAKAPYHWADVQGGTAKPLYWTPERREFEVHSSPGGRFILVEQFFPGWEARVDGHIIEIERFDSAFQSISVPAGDHRIAFKFRPRVVLIGAGLSFVALAVLLLVAFSNQKAVTPT